MSIRVSFKPEEANVVTHSGNFHADDIFSLVLMEKIFGSLTVFRSNTIYFDANNFNPDTIIFDIGYGKFDHHQKEGNGYHPNNNPNLKAIPYASFGLLWKEFGHQFCMNITNNNTILAKKLWEEMENNFVIGIDAIDNGIYSFTPEDYNSHRTLSISNIISLFNPYTNNGENVQDALNQALFFARLVFDVTVDRILCRLIGKKIPFKENPKFFTANTVFSFAILSKIYPNSFEKSLFNLDSWNHETYEEHEPAQNSKDFLKKPIPAATLGKIWNKLGFNYCSTLYNYNEAKYVSNFIRSYLIMGLDANTNGILPCSNPEYVPYNIMTISDFIEALNPIEYSEEAYNNCWYVAKKLAQLIITRVENKAFDRVKGKRYVETKIKETLNSDKIENASPISSTTNILVLDQHVHWQDWVATSSLAKKIYFVISPSNKGGYIIQPVPCKYNENGFRKGFPSSWYGLHGDELKKITNISTANFVHRKNGFIGAADDLLGAVEMAKLACEMI